MHGARGGHGPGCNNPAYKHGMRGQEWVEARREINELVQEAREIERMLSGDAM